ncbi:hypothetical protein N9864_00700 [bacterium]|nr:hypothetical protein [bacterium]MDB4277021.1 hypothetical protein [bacterium]MDB4319787.1 hypothetical protein [bacterium]MDB9992551.1 hypothetical protein [bacterium]
MDKKSKEEILKLLEVELSSNLDILIDPKKKDSLSQNRISVWKDVVKERIYLHLFENNLNKK